MKKRLIISSYDDVKNPIYGGGGATAVFEIAKRLRRVYDVTVYTSTYPGALNQTLSGVEFRRLGTNIFGPKLGQLIFQLCLPFVALTQKFDLWIESFTPPFSTAFIPLFTPRPVIALVHMLAAADMQRKYKLPFHLIENLGLKVYRHFITLSNDSQQHIQKINSNSDFLTVGNGVDMPKRIQSRKLQTHDYLLFMGRIEVDQKGLDLLLIAYKQVLKKYLLRLKIAGTGDQGELDHLAALISSYGLSSHIDLVGRVAGATKDKLYRKAKLVLIPSRYETFSLTALESLSYGIPIVCFDIPGMTWLNSKIVAKAKVENSTVYANKIIHLLKNDDLVKRISSLSISTAKKFSWDSVAEKYLKYIKGII